MKCLVKGLHLFLLYNYIHEFIFSLGGTLLLVNGIAHLAALKTLALDPLLVVCKSELRLRLRLLQAAFLLMIDAAIMK